jgi:hypothetical protein
MDPSTQTTIVPTIKFEAYYRYVSDLTREFLGVKGEGVLVPVELPRFENSQNIEMRELSIFSQPSQTIFKVTVNPSVSRMREPRAPMRFDICYLGLQAFLWSRLGVCTAETLRTPSKEVLIKKSSDLCELGASVVNPSSHLLSIATFRSLALRSRAKSCEFLCEPQGLLATSRGASAARFKACP